MPPRYLASAAAQLLLVRKRAEFEDLMKLVTEDALSLRSLLREYGANHVTQ